MKEESERIKVNHPIFKEWNKILVKDNPEYIKLQQENQQLKDRINKATNKIDDMFNRGDEFTIIDDLIELDKLLKGDKE